MSPLPTERIERAILLIRGERVMLDEDLAKLYMVETRMLLQAVKRNSERFPPDFAFQLTRQEFRNLRSQFVISSWGGRRYPPYAFTEQGVAMLSSVLHSPRAILVNIAISEPLYACARRWPSTRSWHRAWRTWSGRSQATMRVSRPCSRLSAN